MDHSCEGELHGLEMTLATTVRNAGICSTTWFSLCTPNWYIWVWSTEWPCATPACNPPAACLFWTWSPGWQVSLWPSASWMASSGHYLSWQPWLRQLVQWSQIGLFTGLGLKWLQHLKQNRIYDQNMEETQCTSTIVTDISFLIVPFSKRKHTH